MERASELKHIPERQRDAIYALPHPYYPTVTIPALTVPLASVFVLFGTSKASQLRILFFNFAEAQRDAVDALARSI